MSLRKPPTRTAAFLAANRRNAQKSTGPKTARGKAWTRFNSLHTGVRSSELINFHKALLDAPACRVEATATAILRSRQNHHPLFLEAAEDHLQVEIDLCNEGRRNRAWRES